MAKAKKKSTGPVPPTAKIDPKIDPKIVPTDRPYLSAAIFAEKVLREADGVFSVVRIVDRVGLLPESINSVLKDTIINLPITMLIAFKTGGFAGEAVVTLLQTNPSGESQPVGLVPVKFDGMLSTTTAIISPLAMSWDKEGEYFVDVFLGDVFCTRMYLYLGVGKV